MGETRIKMQAVLAEINQYEKDGELHTFSIDYVKKDYSKGKKLKCRKAGGKVIGKGAGEKSNFKFRIKEKGVLLLTDCYADKTFAVKISLLTHYNGMRIEH